LLLLLPHHLLQIWQQQQQPKLWHRLQRQLQVRHISSSSSVLGVLLLRA
jgi:hypothetical protein